MTAAPVVGVVGMRALRADIRRQVDSQQSELWAELEQAGIRAVAPIAQAARSALPVSDRSTPSHERSAGKLLDSIRVASTKTGAGVRMGGARVNWAGWVEFGGSRPDGSTREFIADGRYLFPAARGLAGPAADYYSAALGRVFSSDSVWTNTTSNGGQVHD